jgi:hypothetical protein
MLQELVVYLAYINGKDLVEHSSQIIELSRNGKSFSVNKRVDETIYMAEDP